jgi:hypothetical protein
MPNVLSSPSFFRDYRERAIVHNEAGALTICLSYYDAQLEYAREDHTGEGVLEFAKRLLCSPGQRDGLFWKTEDGDLEGPLGNIPVDTSGFEAGPSDQFSLFGYHYRILTCQGENAVGGSRDFLANGYLTGGFGLMAWPVEYGMSGINTFIINHLGQVFEKDLGPGSADASKVITKFDPDETWTRVE